MRAGGNLISQTGSSAVIAAAPKKPTRPRVPSRTGAHHLDLELVLCFHGLVWPTQAGQAMGGMAWNANLGHAAAAATKTPSSSSSSSVLGLSIADPKGHLTFVGFKRILANQAP